MQDMWMHIDFHSFTLMKMPICVLTSHPGPNLGACAGVMRRTSQCMHTEKHAEPPLSFAEEAPYPDAYRRPE